MPLKTKVKVYDDELQYKMSDAKTYAIRIDKLEERRAQFLACAGGLVNT
jgi:hypothetical protein